MLLLKNKSTLLLNLVVELEELSIVVLTNFKLEGSALLLSFVAELKTVGVILMLIEVVIEIEDEVCAVLLLLTHEVVNEELVLKELPIDFAIVELGFAVRLMGGAGVTLLVELESTEL